MTPALRPEVELVLCCARTRLDAQAVCRANRILAQPVDWAAVLDFAVSQGVAPLLFRHIQTVAGDRVPAPILQSLKDRFLANVSHNLYLTAELLRLIELFAAHGIEVVPFKGPVLAQALYGDVALREFVDLDFLVSRRDVEAARTLVESCGYILLDNVPQGYEEAYLRRHYEYMLVRSRDGMVAEIQWAIVPEYFSCALDPESTGRPIGRITLGGRTVPNLAPEVLLLILCVHGSKHQWVKLGWICDISELLRANPPLDWDWLLRWARSLGAERMLLLGLTLANRYLQAEIPAELAVRIENDHHAKTLAADTALGLFGGGISGAPVLSMIRYHLRARECWQDRLRYCFRFAFMPTIQDWRFFPLPGPLRFLHYATRFPRLAGKYILRRSP